MEPSVFWTMCAAIATTISAGVIGWQSFETRRSAGQAKRSADASESAVAAANKALELTRQQAKYSQIMAAEAIRSRMEAQAPAITVSFSDKDDEGQPKPFAFAVGSGLDSERFQQVEPGHAFWETRDDDQWLFAVVRTMFTNTGPHPIIVSTPVLLGNFGDGELSGSRRRMALQTSDTNKTGGGFMLIGAKISQWVYATKQAQVQNIVGGSTAWWTELEGESGVQITQDFKIWGTLLESGNQKGEWRLRGFGPDLNLNYSSALMVDPQKRRYVIGVDRNGKRHELPPLDPDEVVPS